MKAQSQTETLESNPGKYPEWGAELQSEASRGLLALGVYLHKAWHLPGSVEDLLKEAGLENSQLENIVDSGAEQMASEPEEATNA